MLFAQSRGCVPSPRIDTTSPEECLTWDFTRDSDEIFRVRNDPPSVSNSYTPFVAVISIFWWLV